MKSIFLVIMLMPLFLLGDMSKEDLMTVYIYNFGRDVKWPAEEKINSFNIYMFGQEKGLQKSFEKLAASKKLKGAKISFKQVDDMAQIINPHIIYVSSQKHKDYSKFFGKIEGKAVLLVTNNFENQRLVMINLLSKKGSVKFEINKANILNNKLETNQKLILNGGTEIDVARLYRQGQKSLATLERKLQAKQASIKTQQEQIKNQQEKLEVQQKNIFNKQKEFSQLKEDFSVSLEKFNSEIADANKQITEKSSKNLELEAKLQQLGVVIKESTTIINDQKEEIVSQKKVLDEKIKDREKLINEISGKVNELTSLKSEFEEQKSKVTKKEFQINQIREQISESMKVLKQQQVKIDDQNLVLKAQGKTIDSQKRILQLLWFIVLLVTLLVVTLSWAYINKRRVHNQLMLNDAKLQKANDELLVAKDLALNASHSKSLFLANMSHEIRTPMNAILGFSEMLKKRLKKPEEKMFISSIQSSGKTLFRLIDDILDLSKVEAGKLELNYGYVNTSTLFQEVKNIFVDKMIDKKLEFKIDIDDAFPKAIILDEVRLKQILFNLIGNAAKFTDTGFVKVVASSQKSSNDERKVNLIIKVIDSGIGIPDVHKENIFGTFEQRTGQSMSKYGGTGLGLAISKNLVELMNGVITVKDSVDHGATFVINIPQVEVPKFENPQNKEDLQYLSYEFEPAKILIVDDVQFNRKVIETFLSDYPFDLIEAKDGNEAVSLAKGAQFDLIFMDDKMPELNGYEAAKAIKSQESTSEIPIIALTASVLDKEGNDLYKECDTHLRKPVSQKQLILEVAKFIPYKVKDNFEQIVQHKQHFEVPEDLKKEIQEQLKILEEGVNTTAIKEILNILRQHKENDQCLLLANELEELLKKFDLFSVQQLIRDTFQEST